MEDSDDAGPSEMLTAAQESTLQIVGSLASALSIVGIVYVLAHHSYVHCCRRSHPRAADDVYAPPQPRQHMDFAAKQVFVLALFDLITAVARVVGRSVVNDRALCQTQAAAMQLSSLGSCLWISCMAYNLFRWITGGESDATRQKRFPVFLVVSLVPGAALVAFHLLTDKYGDATFYCWLREIRFMFFNFYAFYLVMVVFNIVLLVLIHFNMKQRVARHDTVEADTSSMLIGRKILLYIVIFITHRTPLMIYRIFEAAEMSSLGVGLVMQAIQDLNGFSNSIVYGGLCRRRTSSLSPLRDYEAESLSSPTDSMLGSFNIKKRTAVLENEHEAMLSSASRAGAVAARVSRKNSCGSDSGSVEDLAAQRRRLQSPGQDDSHSSRRPHHENWHQRLHKRFSRHHTSPPRPTAPIPPKKLAIFTSTFNMGEKNVDERELECMDLADLQAKILRHLVSGSTSKFVHYSREIGKRATALGYHGYIALSIFVRATAVASGRFQMTQRQKNSKNTQEVFRGKSLLVFGRASNKGAVGMSFRFDDTSFAFVTCHLASDSSSLKRGKRKKNSGQAAGCGNSAEALQNTQSVSVSSNGRGSSSGSRGGGRGSGGKGSVSESPTVETHHPPSKVERRNLDAMEILQQLYLDEEDYGFGFPLLHHHSFILGDFNYRMVRKGATPTEMLELLVNVGSEHQATCASDVESVRLSSPISPAILQPPPIAVLSPRAEEGAFQECMTPKVESPTPVAMAKKRNTQRVRTGTANSYSCSGSSSSSVPFGLRSIIEEHDELYQLCRSQQLFHGFQEHEIGFFPTFRRIRGQQLQAPLDVQAFVNNYSLVASHGGFRVPSYTDRVLFSSLAGVQDSLCCLWYDSCEAMTTSDHKPVSACFEVTLLSSPQAPTVVLGEDSPWNTDSTSGNPRILQPGPTASALVAARMKDLPGACELRLRIEFRSIHWIDAVDSSVFDRAEQVQFCFLFPLPCEDVFAPQRKLHEVAEHLTFGDCSGTTGGLGFASTVTPTSNFHALKWHEFVNGGLRYHTMTGPIGRKHVAVLLRSSSRGRSLSKTSSAARLLGNGVSLSPHASGSGPGATCSPTPRRNSSQSTASSSSSSSFSSEQLFGHGSFCAEGLNRKRDVCVPLTLGGRLLGRLQLRVSLQMRQQR